MRGSVVPDSLQPEKSIASVGRNYYEPFCTVFDWDLPQRLRGTRGRLAIPGDHLVEIWKVKEINMTENGTSSSDVLTSSDEIWEPAVSCT